MVFCRYMYATIAKYIATNALHLCPLKKFGLKLFQCILRKKQQCILVLLIQQHAWKRQTLHASHKMFFHKDSSRSPQCSGFHFSRKSFCQKKPALAFTFHSQNVDLSSPEPLDTERSAIAPVFRAGLHKGPCVHTYIHVLQLPFLMVSD